MERRGRLEELDRKAEDIRDFILDVYTDPSIGPLLFAYEEAITELVREERRGRRTKIAKRLAARLRAVLWPDERRLIRKLGPLAGPFSDLAVAVARGEISSRRAAVGFSNQLAQLFKQNSDPSHPDFVSDTDCIERCLVGMADRIRELYCRQERGRNKHD